MMSLAPFFAASFSCPALLVGMQFLGYTLTHPVSSLEIRT